MTERSETEQKIKPSDLEAEAARLHQAGKMPSLEQVLAAVAETRSKYADKIREARNQPEHAGIGALGQKP